MDIDNKNFKQNLQKIQQEIKECEFVSVDCEFSGKHFLKIIGII